MINHIVLFLIVICLVLGGLIGAKIILRRDDKEDSIKPTEPPIL